MSKRSYEQVQKDSREWAEERDREASLEKRLDPLVKRSREVAAKVDDYVERMASATAVRKSLNMGDDGPASPLDSLYGAVADRLTHPTTISRNGNTSKEDF